MKMKPRYEHDCCKHCKFIGTFEECDLYYCDGSFLPTVLARYSSIPSDYASGMWLAKSGECPELERALEIAIEKGLFKE